VRGQALLDRLGATLPGDDLDLRPDEPMARHTTNRLGGPADLWARPSSADALQRILAAAHRAEVPVSFVGSGTNLLVRDGGIRGVVINLGRMNQVHRPEVDDSPGRVVVQAGASTGRLLKLATEWELGGVEFLGGVPGSVGGGVVMNAGTYLGEFTDVVQTVDSVRLDGTTVRRTHAQCGFRYRASDLPPNEVIVSATLKLPARARAAIEADVTSLRARRKEREPSGVPNNGSTFKNPPGDHAGRLIEAAGLKGRRVAGAMVSHKHANWLVVDRQHDPPCTSSDLLELIHVVSAEVARTQSVTLELEVKVIGEG
jgi:UDP-N-acetylmuramate dehydrogenase